MLWDAEDATHRCVQTFVVECGAADGSNSSRVNDVDTIFTSFAHVQNYTAAAEACCYTVAAVDYWGRVGTPSAPVCPSK